MTTPKTKMTWAEHWENDHTPWDAGASAPSLASILSDWPLEQSPRPQGRALVPGCGGGHDVFQLAKSGYQAVGLDIAPGVKPRFHSLREKFALTEQQATVIINDFFNASLDELGGTYDLIWDYTFYCAIDHDMRLSWKKRTAELLAPQGILAMLLFPVVPDAPRDVGPPFPLDPDLISSELEDTFERLHLSPATSSHPGREGKEWLSLWKRR